MSTAFDLLPANPRTRADLGIGPVGAWGGVPWAAAAKVPMSLQGLTGRAVAVFRPGHRALLAVTDADIDTDGPGGSTQVDRYWQSQTSLRFAGGKSCDSRRFPGVVLPPAFRGYGVRVGDYALAFWRGAIRSAQVYDVGPGSKAGEVSICLARGLGIVTPETSDHQAATNGNEVMDLVTLFFPGSGDGKAHESAQIVTRCHELWRGFTGRA